MLFCVCVSLLKSPGSLFPNTSRNPGSNAAQNYQLILGKQAEDDVLNWLQGAALQEAAPLHLVARFRSASGLAGVGVYSVGADGCFTGVVYF